MPFIYPDNLTKYGGSINEHETYYQYINKSDGGNFSKKFLIKNYPSKGDAYKAAKSFQIYYAMKHGQVLNKYIQKNADTYVVYLDNEGNDLMIVDKAKLPLVNKYKWRMQNKITYPINEYNYTFHELAFRGEYAIHKNGNKLDNREKNVEIVDNEKYTWFMTHKNRKMRTDNTSGCTGVCKVRVGEYEYWEVRGVDYQGFRILKRFSVKRLGDVVAQSEAILYRMNNIDDSFKPDSSK